MEQPKTINIDGQTYEVEQFSAGVQQAVFIYNTFTADLQRQQLEVMKTQAALQQVGQQITETVKQELIEQSKATSSGSEMADGNASDGPDGVEADPIEQTE